MYGDETTAPQIVGKPAAFWKSQIDADVAARKDLEAWWDANDAKYAPKGTDSPEVYGENINTNRDFTLVERKKADMFYQRPDLTAEPAPWMDGPMMGPDGQPMLSAPNPQTGQPGPPISMQVGLQAHLEILNKQLGPVNVDAVKMAHQALFDVLDLSGVGFTCMGYESVTVDTEVQNPAAALDPLAAPTVTVPVPIYENCFWHYFGPKKAIVPRTFRSTEWDKAPYLGYKFDLPLTPGNLKKFKLPPDFSGSRPDTTQYFDRGGSNQQGDNILCGTILWYRSCLYRQDIVHPDHLTKLVLIDGFDGIAVEEDSKDQTLDERGQLTADSLIGYPVHPLNTRIRTDSSWPAADATYSRPLINELNVSRQQNIQFRDAMTLKWMANGDTLPADAISKIVRAPIGGIIVVPGEAFVGETAFKELPQGTMPRENFGIADIIDSDISRTWALDASQQGVQSGSAQTATAEQNQQANANARLDFERGVTLQWYCKGATKYSTLLQKWFPVAKAAQIVGPERAQIWDAWRKQVPSALAFTAMPDSALRVDQAVDSKQFRDFYSFVAPDPWVQNGRGKLLEKVFRKHHVDPTGIVMPPSPPKPEPPKFSLALKGEDLNPLMPQYPNIYQVLTQNGVQNLAQPIVDPVTATMLQQAQEVKQEGDTAHPGRQAPSENLSKHHSDQSGALQGIGGRPSPMGAGGVM